MEKTVSSDCVFHRSLNCKTFLMIIVISDAIISYPIFAIEGGAWCHDTQHNDIQHNDT